MWGFFLQYKVISGIFYTDPKQRKCSASAHRLWRTVGRSYKDSVLRSLSVKGIAFLWMGYFYLKKHLEKFICLGA